MNSTPSLSSYNRFSCLSIDEINDNDSDENDSKKDVQTSEPPPILPLRRPKWERHLPHCLIIVASPSENSLSVDVEIETTDTASKRRTDGLVDCGASGLFIDTNYVAENAIPTRSLSRPIPVFNVDGTPNEAGSIREVADLVLRYKDHAERALFTVTHLGRQKIILGYTWLHLHNPEINWKTKEVAMS